MGRRLALINDAVEFLHGFTGNMRDWNTIIDAMPKGFISIYGDIIGHGWLRESDWRNLNNYNMGKIASEKVLFQRFPTNHLVGYSMGGRLALYIATHYPDKIQSLTLISASPGLKTEAEREARRKADNELADKIEKNGMEWFVDFWGNLPLWDSQSAELKAHLRENRLQNNPLGLANSLRGMGTGVMPSLWDKLADLPMPVKLIVGELDKKFVAINQEMAALIPNCELNIIPNTGHATHLEKPDVFKDSLLDFLYRHKTP